MFAVFACILLMVRVSVEWAVSSEQASEVAEVAQDVAYTESMMLANGMYMGDDLGQRDRFFFYVFDKAGNLQNYSRASEQLEHSILEVINNGQVPVGDVSMVELKDSKNKKAVLLLTSTDIILNHTAVGTVFVGKDVTAFYKGIKKSTYFMAGISLIALIIAAFIGYSLSGKVISPMEEAYERQRQFAADASHELRTPLAVVMASADMLQSDPSITSPICKQVIDDLKDEVKKMTKLVGDLLTVARSDGNAEKLAVTEFSISETFQQIIRNMQAIAEQKNITLTGNIPDDMVYRGDQQKISQLIMIFVDNAIKYTPKGGEVSVNLQEKKGKKNLLTFSVSDTGIGIAKEDQEKIFGRFYRVDKARSREMGGNGLGLAIAMGIINSHHGKVYVDSVLEKGTTFTIELKNL